MRPITILPLALALMTAGCAVEPTPSAEVDEQPITVVPDLQAPVHFSPDDHPSDGDLCIFANEPGLLPVVDGAAEEAFAEGDRFVARVSLPECLSQSCDVDRVAHCEVIRVGRTLIVSSVLEYTEKEDGPCTLDCGRLTATCESEPLDAGSYRIVHGNDSLAFDVPSSVTACPFVAEEQASELAEKPECEEDADCTNGYCHGDGSCLEWAEVDEWCGGYAPDGYTRRCAPDLVCVNDSPFPDFPGKCAVSI